MKIRHRCSPDGAETSIEDRVVRDVSRALGSIVTRDNEFVVNDSEWFIQLESGNLTPCAMNAAKFLSDTFQNTLRDEWQWDKEKELSGQKIDAYIELPSSGQKFRIPPTARFLDFFQEWCEHFNPENVRNEFLGCWRRFVQVGVNRPIAVGKPFRSFFKKAGTGVVRIRIGLEFETGNIGSSLRALDKLEALFLADVIDYGVFITSADEEHVAARTWLQSNRNGSFTELENRNYRHNHTVPLWEFGYEPDAFDHLAPYFNNAGLYEPEPMDLTAEHAGVIYEIFRRGSEKVLRRASPQRSRRPDTT